MTPTDDLFQLIKSLTRTEKRYFKVFASQHVINEQNNYVKLFDAIEKQEEYDEREIKEIFKKETFIHHLPPQKVYLYNLILRSMELYHYDIESDLRSTVNQIKILYNKGLFKHCEKRIVKAKKIAQKYEKFPVLFDLLRWEGHIAYINNHENKTIEEVVEIYDQLKDSLRIYEEIIFYVALVAKIEIARKKMGSLRTDDERKKYEALIKNTFDVSEEKIRSFEAKAFYFHGIYADAFFKKEIKRGVLSLEKAYKLIEEHPYRIEDNPRLYSITIQNLIVFKRNLKQYEEAEALIQKFKNLDFKNKILNEENSSNASHAEIMLCIVTGEFDKGLKVLKEMEKEKFHLEVFQRNREHEINFYYNAAIINFGVGDYVACNKYLNKIIINEDWDLRSDLHCFARIMLLMSNYERNREDLIEYSFKNVYKFLAKRDRIYKLEKVLLEYIRTKLQHANTRKKQLDAFQELKEELIEIGKNTHEKRALSYFHFIPWLDSKIEGKPFPDMVKRKIESER